LPVRKRPGGDESFATNEKYTINLKVAVGCGKKTNTSQSVEMELGGKGRGAKIAEFHDEDARGIRTGGGKVGEPPRRDQKGKRQTDLNQSRKFEGGEPSGKVESLSVWGAIGRSLT